MDSTDTCLPSNKPSLAFVIYHSAQSHVQSNDDCVRAFYNLPFTAICEASQTGEETCDEVIAPNNGEDIAQLHNSAINEYRKKSNYFGPLKIVEVPLKILENEQVNEMLQLKLIRVNLNCSESLQQNDFDYSEQSGSQFSGHLQSSCELPFGDGSANIFQLDGKKTTLLESYNDVNRELFSVELENDVVNVSRKAVDEFLRISGLCEPFEAQREKVYVFVNTREIPVTVVHLIPADVVSMETECPVGPKETKPTSKRGRPRGRGRRMVKGNLRREWSYLMELDKSMNQLRTLKTRRNCDNIFVVGSDSHLSAGEITDAEEEGIGSFGCETGIVVNGSATELSLDGYGGDSNHAKDLPILELDSTFEDMNSVLSSSDIWELLTQYLSKDCQVQANVTQLNNERWLEVKRMSNFYEVDGEILTDLSFKAVYKDTVAPVRYFLRGFSRLLKKGELNTVTDVGHLFRFMSGDHKLCLGLKPSPYQQSIESNDQVRQYFKEKGELVSTPFDCLFSKSCRGIVKINMNTPSSTFKRMSKNITGVQALCRACATLGKKMNLLMYSTPRNGAFSMEENSEKVFGDNSMQFLKSPLKRHQMNYNVGDSFLHFLKQPLKKSGMSYSALKYLFTQSIPEILSDKESTSYQSTIDDTDLEEEDIVAGRKPKKQRVNQEGGRSKSSIGVTEEKFIQMIDLHTPKSEGVGRYLLKRCNLCQFRAPTMLSLVTHMKGHLGMLREKCSQCEITLSSKDALEIHRRQVHVERSPVCSICEIDFTTNDQLFDHMNKHRNHLPFECPYCKHKLSNKEAYKKHLRLTHKITSVKDLKFNCKTCNIYFYTQDHVLLHRVNQNHEGIEPFICRACSASCSSANEFRHHIMEHTEEERDAVNLAICPECFKVFFSRFRLAFHIETKHSNIKVKPEPPQQDDIKSETIVAVKKKKNKGPYLRYLRANERFECPKCKRRFKTSLTLERHKKFAHADKKSNKTDYICSLCGREFSTVRRLSTHMKIHAGNRPVFQCEECGKIYGKKMQVLEHIRVDHAEQVERHQQQQQQQQEEQQQQQELMPSEQSQEQQFVDIHVQQHNPCIEGSASTSWSPIKSPFKVPTVEQTQEAVYSLLQLTDF